MMTRRSAQMEKKFQGNLLKGVAFVLLLAFAVSVPTTGYCEGKIDALKEYEYWADGKVRGCKVYDTDGRLRTRSFCRPDGSVEKIEKYDMAGNKVQEGHFDPRGNLTAGLDGWAVMKWEYDNDLHVRSQMSFDEMGRPIERKLYSEGGKMVMRQFRDSDNLNTFEEAQMAMFLGGANVKMKNPDE
jgi:hypothetical protein